VPFVIYNGGEITYKEGDFGLANVAATVVELLGLKAPEQWLESMIRNK
jgi:Phosphoglyceromutase